MQQLTPPGIAGVACVRAAAGERQALLACLRNGEGAPLRLVAGGPPLRARLHLQERVVDDVLVVDRGDAGLEVHLHGSPAVLELLDRHFDVVAALAPSAAARLLREAISVEQLDLALEQLDAGFDDLLADLAQLPAAARKPAAAAALTRSRAALALATPQRLVLVGAQNAGKSSLFNRLLFRERVLTGPLAGLTRDPVAEITSLAGYPYELVDTAGMGEFATELEARAFAAGQHLRAGAMVLLVVDAHLGLRDADRALLLAGEQDVVLLRNKSDLVPAPWPDDTTAPLSVSATQEPSALLRARIGAHLRELRALPPAGPVGGAAALDQDQWQRLAQLADSTSAPWL